MGLGGNLLPASAPTSLTLTDSSGRALTLEQQEDGSVSAWVKVGAFRWAVIVDAADVARLKEWLG